MARTGRKAGAISNFLIQRMPAPASNSGVFPFNVPAQVTEQPLAQVWLPNARLQGNGHHFSKEIPVSSGWI